MRTTEEILKFIEEKVRNALKRPLSYSANAEGFEILMLSTMGTYSFAMGNDARIFDEWFKFANRRVRHSGPHFVAKHLESIGSLDENWTELVELLDLFWVKQIRSPKSAPPSIVDKFEFDAGDDEEADDED